jgi:hypothetical protein
MKGDAWKYNILTSLTNDTQWNESQQNWPQLMADPYRVAACWRFQA